MNEQLKRVQAQFQDLTQLVQTIPIHDDTPTDFLVDLGEVLFQATKAFERKVDQIKTQVRKRATDLRESECPGEKHLTLQTEENQLLVTFQDQILKCALPYGDLHPRLGEQLTTFFKVSVQPRPDFQETFLEVSGDNHPSSKELAAFLSGAVEMQSVKPRISWTVRSDEGTTIDLTQQG